MKTSPPEETVAERVKEEQAKERARERDRLSLLLSASPAVVYTREALGDHATTFVSRQVTELLGHTPGDFLADARFWASLIHPQDRERVLHELTSLPGRDTHTHEYRLRHQDGSYRWVRDDLKLLRDAAGQPQEIIGAWIDMTHGREAQLQLERSESRYRSFVEKFHGIAYRGSLDFVPEFVHGAVEEITGYAEGDFIAGKPTWDQIIFPADLEAAHEDGLKMQTRPGYAYEREYRIVSKSGKIRWVRDFSRNVTDKSGRPDAIEGVLYDITDHKEIEEEHRLLQAKMQHGQKLESLGVLAGGLAHDFNNLLTSVLGNADLALQNLAPEAPGREYVERVEQAAARAAELTGQMLAYSGKGKFVVKPIQVSRLVEEMGHLLETVISKKTQLELDLASDLPPIEADGSQVRQVVMNLITNASEALGEETGTVRVTTGVLDADREYLGDLLLGDELEAGRFVYLDVDDTGSGMDAETRDRIFDPFFTTKFTGRGLGLAAVLGIVKGHQGAIEVHGEPGRGSSFKVLFPASQADLLAPEARCEVPRANLEGATVLLVDDDPGVRAVAEAMLAQGGFRILTAADGIEGVEALRQHPDDVTLVLLDMTMPGMDGKEAFREMRRIAPEIRVILSSGFNEQEATSRFVGQGLAGFIQKPYRSDDLLAKVYEVLEG